MYMEEPVSLKEQTYWKIVGHVGVFVIGSNEMEKGRIDINLVTSVLSHRRADSVSLLGDFQSWGTIHQINFLLKII